MCESVNCCPPRLEHESHVAQLRAEAQSQAAHESSGHHMKPRSQHLVDRLKHKRLGQIFEYLVRAHDTPEEGLDLTQLDPIVLDTLDWEVRADVDAAVRLFELRLLRRG